MSDVVRLEYRNVTMRFAQGNGDVLTAIRGVSFSVRDGEVVSLIGPSGCGKSTLLNIGSGLTQSSEGETFVDGVRVEGPSSQVAFMLQKDLLLPWRDIAANVMFGLEVQGARSRSAACAHKHSSQISASRSFPATIRTNCRAACASVSR